MPIEFSCPSGHVLTMPEDYVGAMVECPLCGERLRVPAASRALAAVPVADEVPPAFLAPNRPRDDLDAAGLDRLGRPVTSGEEKNSLRIARIGISFHRAKVLVFVLGLVFCVLASGLIFLVNFQPIIEKQIERDLQKQQQQQRRRLGGPWGARPPAGWPPPNGQNGNNGPFQDLDPDLQDDATEALHKSSKQAELLFWSHSSLTALLGLIGSWYLLAVPRSSHAGGLIAFSLVMDLVHLAAAIVNETFFRGQHWILGLVGVASIAFAYITFMMFLHRFALFLGEQELARHASHHLRLWSRLISGSVICVVGGLYMLMVNPAVAALILVVGFVLIAIFWLMWVFGYLRLLRQMAATLDQRLAA